MTSAPTTGGTTPDLRGARSPKLEYGPASIAGGKDPAFSGIAKGESCNKPMCPKMGEKKPPWMMLQVPTIYPLRAEAATPRSAWAAGGPPRAAPAPAAPPSPWQAPEAPSAAAGSWAGPAGLQPGLEPPGKNNTFRASLGFRVKKKKRLRGHLSLVRCSASHLSLSAAFVIWFPRFRRPLSQCQTDI